MINLMVLVICVIVTVLLTRYVVMDTEKIRNHKKFIKDMEDFEKEKPLKKYEPMNNGSKYFISQDEWVDEDDD
jgi:uncharacterized membrane protein (DUF106 family)|tara:strand:- start:1351 stop:1569 length:219 start_codon:yes stop_codon:yes gene_type:complete